MPPLPPLHLFCTCRPTQKAARKIQLAGSGIHLPTALVNTTGRPALWARKEPPSWPRSTRYKPSRQDRARALLRAPPASWSHELGWPTKRHVGVALGPSFWPASWTPPVASMQVPVRHLGSKCLSGPPSAAIARLAGERALEGL